MAAAVDVASLDVIMTDVDLDAHKPKRHVERTVQRIAHVSVVVSRYACLETMATAPRKKATSSRVCMQN